MKDSDIRKSDDIFSSIFTGLAEPLAQQLQKLSVDLIETEEYERQRIAGILHDDLQQLLAGARLQVQALDSGQPSLKQLKNLEHLLDESIKKSRDLSYELSPPVLHRSGLFAALQWLANRMKEQSGLQVHLKTQNKEQFESSPVQKFIFRAVQELLFNTVKHAGVNTSQVSLEASDQDLTIIVSDQGKGFKAETLASDEKIGLGLMNLKTRARLFGGALSVESAPGWGSRITLKVPLNLAEHFEAKKIESTINGSPAKSATQGEMRVIFADDHKVIRQGFIRLIESQPDIQVVGEAADGEEALDLARKLNPDVIVMDVSMPKMDGVEATRRINAEMPNIRVIGLSMYEDEHINQVMREAGAEAFLTKTVSSADLLKAIYGVNGQGKEEEPFSS